MEFKDEIAFETANLMILQKYKDLEESALILMQIFLEEGHTEEDYKLASTYIFAVLNAFNAMRERNKNNDRT